MGSIIEILRKLECKRCSHRWWPRSEEIPKRCPSCTSLNWQKTRAEVKRGRPPKMVLHRDYTEIHDGKTVRRIDIKEPLGSHPRLTQNTDRKKTNEETPPADR